MLVPRQRSHCAHANADVFVYMIIGYTAAYLRVDGFSIWALAQCVPKI